MKNLKIYALFLGLGLLTACNNDEDPVVNTTDATVSFGDKTAISVLETAGVYRIPLTVSKEMNGVAKVKFNVVDLTTTNEDGEQYTTAADVDYYITQQEVTISEGDAYFEIKVVHDYQIVGARKFKVELIGAEGVKVDESSSCEVTIEEVDDQLYYRMLNGTWKMESQEASEEAPMVSGTVTFSNGSTSTDQILNANEKFLCTGFFDGTIINSAGLVWTLKFDEKKLQATLVRSESLEDLNFGEELGLCTAYVSPLSGAGKPSDELVGSITVDVEGNPVSISFNGALGVIIYSDADGYKGQALLYAAYNGLKMTFVPKKVNK